jgi:CBS domain-containing protein
MPPADAGNVAPAEGAPFESLDPDAVPVAEVMSPAVVAIRADCHLSVAVDRFAITGVRQLVVVDAEGRLAGLVSHERVGAAWLEPRGSKPTWVHQVVEASGLSVPPQTSVREVAQLMVRHGAHAVPVVDSAGALVGVVTHTDLVRLLAGQS